MKIEAININGVLGIRHAQIRLDTPVTIFAGPNGSGKSSLLDAVRMSLIKHIPRTDKKHRDGLVHDGAKNGTAAVQVDGKGYGINILDDIKSQHLFDDPETSIFAEVALGVTRFADVTDKRGFLFNLTGCKATPEEIAKMLADRGAPAC